MAVVRECGTTANYIAGCRCDQCGAAIKEYRSRRAALIRAGIEPIRHGRYASYVSGCRCRPCTDAMAAKRRKTRARQRDEHRRGIARPPHGTPTGYREYGCRCDECRAANTISCLIWKRGRSSSGEAARFRVEIRNAEFRREEMEAALRVAGAELLALIEEQEHDRSRGDCAPRWLVSFDAPSFEDGGDRYGSGLGAAPRHAIEWLDPVGDAVMARV